MAAVKIESPKPRHARGTLVHTEAMASTPAERAARTPAAKPPAAKPNAAKRKSAAKKADARRTHGTTKAAHADNGAKKRTSDRRTAE
jgi:hypothetical protein